MIKTLFQLPLLSILLSINAYADGKFYSKDRVPPNLPYQRAIISHKDGKELLIVQSKFDGPGEEFGWVIPVPSPPKMGTLQLESISELDALFRSLGRSTQPEITYVGSILGIGLFFLGLGCLFTGAIVGYWRAGGLFKPLPKAYRQLIFVSPLLLFSALPLTLGMLGSAIEVLSSERVGIFDTHVIKASDPKALFDWLKGNGFHYSQADEAAFKAHIDRGWCFATARIDARKLKEGVEFRSREGLAHPLVLLFESREIVYPLALTGTGAKETEVLLYVFADYRTGTDDRFRIKFAGPADRELTWRVHEKIEPGNLFDDKLWGHTITKFHGRLSSEAMKTDAVFTRAADNKPYREHMVRW